MKVFLFITAFTVVTITTHAQKLGSLTGTVVQKTTQLPLPNVTITLSNSTLATSSDTAGKFTLSNIPTKTYNINASAVGYKKTTVYNVVVTSGNSNNYTIELDKDVTSNTAIVVRANRRTVKAATLETPLSIQRLTTEEIKSSPGGNFDISKVIQTLPGVGGGAQGGSFRNDIIIRGGAPNENVFYLDGIEVPVINHFQTQGSSGGPQGMLNVSFIEDVKLTTSAFDARYDNAISSVFQFKQKNGNTKKLQGNFRLSATEVALTLDGPLSKNKKTTFLASARRSYLQLLFKAIDLPIRPNYWDYQAKVTHNFNKKNSLNFIVLGAIDEFRFEAPKTATPEKLFIINASPLVNQWNYTVGASFKHLTTNGFYNIALSQTNFNNDIQKYEDNQNPTTANKTLDITSGEIETKLRADAVTNLQGWKVTYGASAQLASYTNRTIAVIAKQLTDGSGNIIQPAITANFNSPLKPLVRLGAFVQAGKRFASNRLGVSAGLRSDMNTFTTTGMNGLQTLSPRLSLSYTLSDQVTLNSTVGSYYKLAPYTQLGYANNAGQLVNKNAKYLQSNHLTTGVEYVPNDALRVTFEGFYKRYNNVPVSLRSGISLANLGADFNLLGNEAITTTGKGKTYGVELFLQKKLTQKFFGILSYTYYRSLYSGLNGNFIPSSWDNRQLLSLTWGYKLPRSWEFGLRLRYQGGAPFTPFDEGQSRLNFLSQGQGTLDFSRLNTQRLRAFNSSDVRIDKKWNFKKTTINLFLDVSNWYLAKAEGQSQYTFKRNDDNTNYLTSNNQPIQPNGSNAIPVLLPNNDAIATPTLGLIVEF